MRPTVLVAGVGNVFLGDDGFGVEVARRLSEVDIPEWARVVDYGIRGMHLAYDLAGGGYELTILVDATSRGEPPGTVYVIELDTAAGADVAPILDAHGMQPDVVLRLVATLGEDPGRVLLVGCEPDRLDQHMGLSPAVERAVPAAISTVLDLLAEHGRGAREETPCASAFPGK
ncbi:hydrogenase maturation protease [Actinophytocola sp.]|uniref:hydrogenase maturation protease n=1 Tax=Actinophytocola sp. TaxID=1872138 RepID=UPI002D7E7033|nr:hydrogenase maturation protease [Actinophytocola sp.]HET9138641.1 hydrogenase maturation protease [Actinophytocola sp.]HEU5107521.1 hydrogenase maturation protease [Micromonosporaceae bacterium]